MKASGKFKSGFVSIVGRPNVGKSTLLNSLLQEKVSIVSRVPQTTRYAIRGILNLKQAQIVFVDTPGVHLYKYKLSTQLNIKAKDSLKGIEVILYVVDCLRRPHKEEENIMDILVKKDTPLIMVLNKIDKAPKYINEYIELWGKKTGQKIFPLKYFIPLSALRGNNLDKLIESILEFLPYGEAFYEKGTITDFPLSYRASDLIREKICNLLREELPHSAAVDVIEIKQEDKLVSIFANILVVRKSQRAIILGEKGKMIKEIGSLARRDLELVFGKKVFLELWVKVEPDWQNTPRVLRELGYTDI